MDLFWKNFSGGRTGEWSVPSKNLNVRVQCLSVLTVFLLGVFMIGCGGSDSSKKSKKSVISSVSQQKRTNLGSKELEEEIIKVSEKDKIIFDIDRNPFISVSRGRIKHSLPVETGGIYIPDLAQLRVKGIVISPKGRLALMVGSQDTYIAKEGKLWNSRRKQIPTLATVVEDKGVRLISASESVMIKLRDEIEEEKKR